MSTLYARFVLYNGGGGHPLGADSVTVYARVDGDNLETTCPSNREIEEFTNKHFHSPHPYYVCERETTFMNLDEMQEKTLLQRSEFLYTK